MAGAPATGCGVAIRGGVAVKRMGPPGLTGDGVTVGPPGTVGAVCPTGCCACECSTTVTRDATHNIEPRTYARFTWPPVALIVAAALAVLPEAPPGYSMLNPFMAQRGGIRLLLILAALVLFIVLPSSVDFLLEWL